MSVFRWGSDLNQTCEQVGFGMKGADSLCRTDELVDEVWYRPKHWQREQLDADFRRWRSIADTPRHTQPHKSIPPNK